MGLALIIIVLHLGVGAVLLRNRRAFRPLPDAARPTGGGVSVLVPARDEEANIEAVVRACMAQTVPVELLVLDDGSTDATAAILQRLRHEYREGFRVLQGSPHPDGWMGKPWACQQLADSATGEVLVFLDADTRPEPDFAARVCAALSKAGGGMVTVWPRQVAVSFWEKAVIPLVYFALLGFLFTDYTRRDPRWMPKRLAARFRPAFAAACGQCIALSRHLYERIGGHAGVRDRVVEDVGLARAVRGMGAAVHMHHGVGSITCRMYAGAGDMWEGFRKNFLAGFGGNVPLFVSAALFHAALYLLPWPMLVWAWLRGDVPQTVAWASAAALPVAQRILLASWLKFPLGASFSHPLGVLWFEALAVRVLADKLLGRKARWKGRTVG